MKDHVASADRIAERIRRKYRRGRRERSRGERGSALNSQRVSASDQRGWVGVVIVRSGRDCCYVAAPLRMHLNHNPTCIREIHLATAQLDPIVTPRGGQVALGAW